MNKDSLFIKRLLLSYSVVLLVVLVLGVSLYTLSINNVSKEIRAQNKLSLEKTIQDIDTSFKTMDLLAGQLVTNPDLVHLTNMEDNDAKDFYLKAYNAQDSLSTYIFTESILPIKSYFIYLEKSNYILSVGQFTDTYFYYNWTKKYHADQYSEWINMLNNESLYRHFVAIDPYKSFSDSSYLYMLPLTAYSFQNVPATICFEIDYMLLERIFSELNFYDVGYLCIVDPNGDIVFTLGNTQDNDISVDHFSQLTYENGLSEYNTSGTDMFVTSSTSGYNDWIYYLVQPMDATLYSLNRYQNMFASILLLAFLVEIIMICFLSKTNVSKFSQLAKDLQDTLLMNKSLQNSVEKQNPIIKQSYLNKIIQGNISTKEELEYAQQYLNISTENRKFSVLYIVAYINQHDIHDETTPAIDPNNTDYKDIIHDAITHFFIDSSYVINTHERTFAVLLSSALDESSESSTLKVQEYFLALHDYLQTTYSIWTFAGLGIWNSGLMVTWKSYQQALQTVSYTTKRERFCYYADLERDTNTFYYPIELTTQLTTFITTGNKIQVLEIFETIRHENLEVRTLSLNMVKYLLSDIRNTLFKIRFSVKSTDANEATLDAIDALFDQHMSLKLCEDLAINLCSLYATSPCGNHLISNIKNYIDNNYMDPSLCLNKISDEFDISESYFSYLFKEEVGENFSSYLGRIRVEHAFKLLKETDISINALYEKVGFNSSHTFRRTFKKIYAMSPKEARYHSTVI